MYSEKWWIKKPQNFLTNLPRLETIPEKKGLVKRGDFLDISGRSRKPQIELAKKFAINDYPAPAGGCLLCDKIFSLRLKDLFNHAENCSERELHLLKYGRHFRLNEKIKIIVGRTQRDNENILKYYHPAADTLIKVKNFPGPITLLPQAVSREAMVTAASICAGYSKSTGTAPVNVSIKTPSGQEIITVDEIPPADVRHLMIWWHRSKSHLLRCSGFSETRHTRCITSFLKNRCALYMKLGTMPSLRFLVRYSMFLVNYKNSQKYLRCRVCLKVSVKRGFASSILLSFCPELPACRTYVPPLAVANDGRITVLV